MGAAPELPEDLYFMIKEQFNIIQYQVLVVFLPIQSYQIEWFILLNMEKRAVGMRKHLERNRKDKDGKFRLILIESRIHRLSRYYRAKGIVPPTFKYESATASALVA